MKRLMLAAASAVAIGLTAQAAEWFNGGIADGWPNASTLSGGAWSNTDDTTYAGGVLDVDAPDDAPLTFTATEAKGPATSVSVEVSMTVTFTPFAEVIAVPDGAKAGMIIAADKYYGIGKVNDAAAWVELGAASDVDQPKVIKVTRTADGLVYSVDGTAFAAVTPVSEESFQYVKMTGTGTLASLSAEEDPGAATVNGKPYATVAAAFAAAKDGDTVKIVNAGTAALGTPKTAATTVDLNGQLVNLTSITFTNATGKVTVKNGELDRYGNTTVTFTTQTGIDLRLEDMTFWCIVAPEGGAGATFESVDCRYLVGKTDKNTYAPEQDGTVTTAFGSGRLSFAAGFTTVDISGGEFQWANRPPITVPNSVSADLVLYVHGVDFNGTTNRNNKGEEGNLYPAAQAIGGAKFYFEGNTFRGKMAQGAFGTYNDSNVSKGTFVISGNTFGEGVKCMSVANGGSADPAVKVYVGANDTTAATEMDTTGGYYKKWFTNPWSGDVNLMKPEGCESFYAWLHGENAAKPYCVNGTYVATLDDLQVGDTVIALPGVTVAVDPSEFSQTPIAPYANAWTIGAAVDSVTLTVNVGAGITSATYALNGVEQGAVTGPITGLKPGDALVFTVADADDSNLFNAAVTSGDLTAGEKTAKTFAFTVNASLTSPVAEIDLAATKGFVKAITLDGTETNLIAMAADAWVYFTNGTHYVELLKDYGISGGQNQLRIQVGDTALIKRNGFNVRYFGEGKVCTVEDVEGKPYQAYVSYANLKAAWDAKKSTVSYWIGWSNTNSGGAGTAYVDASVVTLDNDALVFAGEFVRNTDGGPLGGLTGEPVTEATKTNAWGVTGFTFRYEVEASGPAPDPEDDDCTVTKNGDGSYTVTPKAGSTTATVKGVKATDTIKIDSAADFVLTTDAEPAAIVMELNGSVVPATYFKGGDATVGFDTALSDAAKATLVEETEEQKPLVIGDSVDVTINTVAGLKYQLIRGTEVGTITEALGEPKLGNGEPLKLQDTNKPEGKAFYVIQTSK